MFCCIRFDPSKFTYPPHPRPHTNEQLGKEKASCRLHLGIFQCTTGSQNPAKLTILEVKALGFRSRANGCEDYRPTGQPANWPTAMCQALVCWQSVCPERPICLGCMIATSPFEWRISSWVSDHWTCLGLYTSFGGVTYQLSHCVRFSELQLLWYSKVALRWLVEA